MERRQSQATNGRAAERRESSFFSDKKASVLIQATRHQNAMKAVQDIAEKESSLDGGLR